MATDLHQFRGLVEIVAGEAIEEPDPRAHQDRRDDFGDCPNHLTLDPPSLLPSLRGPRHAPSGWIAQERLASITDGTSNTFLVGEQSTRTVPTDEGVRHHFRIWKVGVTAWATPHFWPSEE